MLSKLSYRMNKAGLSLAEVLVSLFIISLLIFTFTPLILFSFSSIYNAGDARAKLLEDKGNVEVQIADGESASDEEIFVGLLDSSGNLIPGTSGVYQIGMESSGELKAPVIDALAASIAISPSHVTKGYNNRKIYIYGENIHFQSIPSQFRLVSRSGATDHSITTTGFNILSDDTIAEFTLPEGLVPEDKYFIKYGNLEAQLFVDPQKLIAVGENGKYYEADDEQNWSTEKTVSGAGTLNALVYDGERFIAVDSSGKVFNTKTSGDFGWETSTKPAELVKLNDVLFSNDTYYIAGKNSNSARIYEKQGWNGTWTNAKTDNMKTSGTSYKSLIESEVVLMGKNNNSDKLYSLEPNNNEIKYYTLNSGQDRWMLENIKIYPTTWLGGDFQTKKVYDYGNIIDLELYEYSESQSNFKSCTSDGYILDYTSSGWVYDGGYNTTVWKSGGFLGLGHYEYTREKPSNAPEQLNSICYGNNYWVAVGKGKYAMVRKEDGTDSEMNWHTSNALPNADDNTILNKVIFYDGRFYAVGNQAVIYSSADGMTWIREKGTTSTGANLYGIAGR